MAETKLEPPILSEEQRLYLLQLARESIKHALTHGRLPAFQEEVGWLKQPAAVFVTLWQRQEPDLVAAEHPQLRGCIGSLQADLPLYLAVQKSAVSAATRDPRFPAVQFDELEALSIEIAALSSLLVVDSLDEIVIGRDGIVIEAMGRRGLLLPKVATRLGWDRSEFLRNVCLKASLPAYTWPGYGTLYRFRTTEFQEQ